MKKIFALVFLVAFFTATVPVFAEEDKPQDRPMEKGMMKDKGMGMMHGGGMMGMMSKTMVAAGDGGVIVQSGNKLLKYDKDLNLVKEAEIPMAMDSMKKEMCAMCSKKMADKNAAAEASPSEALPADHASHH